MANKINSQITAKNVRVLDEQGNNLGILSISEALKRATAEDKDLVEIVSTSNPPVCKIIEWGKFKYEQKKAVKPVKTPEQKEFRFNINIDPHDLGVKANQIKALLEKKHPIKIVVKFHGREIAHQEMGHEIVAQLKALLPNAIFENTKLEDKQLITNLRHK